MYVGKTIQFAGIRLVCNTAVCNTAVCMRVLHVYTYVYVLVQMYVLYCSLGKVCYKIYCLCLGRMKIKHMKCGICIYKLRR